MKLMWRRIIAILGVTIFAGFVTTGAAYAEAPTPNMPDRDIGGNFLTFHYDPASGEWTDSTDGTIGGEATDPNEGSAQEDQTFFERYGVAAQFYNDTNGDGIGDDITGAVTGGLSNADKSVPTMVANWIMGGAQMLTAATAKTADVVYNTDSWLGPLDPVWKSIGNATNEAFAKPFAPVVAVIVLITVAYMAYSGRLSRVVGSVVIITFCVLGIFVGTNYPAQAGHYSTGIINATTTEFREKINGTTNSESPGYAVVGGLADKIIYDRWVSAMLGDNTSPTAVKYGPVLYEAQAFSWTEAAQYRNDPEGAGKDIIDRKADEWENAVDDIRDTDPDAYAYLSGEKGGANRVWQAVMMNLTWFATMPMIFASLFVFAMAVILLCLIFSWLPVLGIIAVIPRFHGLAKSIGETLLACVFNSIIFGLIASAVALICTFLMTELNWIVGLLMCAVVNVLAWVVSAPFRKLTRMVANIDPIRGFQASMDKLTGALKGLAGAAVGAAAGGVVGGAVGGKIAGNKTAEAVGDQSARQTFPPRPTYTHPDIVDAELVDHTPTRTSFAAGAVGDVIEGEVVEDTLRSPVGAYRDSGVIAIGGSSATSGTDLATYDGAPLTVDVPVVVTPIVDHDNSSPVILNEDVTVVSRPQIISGPAPRDESSYLVFDPSTGSFVSRTDNTPPTMNRGTMGDINEEVDA